MAERPSLLAHIKQTRVGWSIAGVTFVFLIIALISGVALPFALDPSGFSVQNSYALLTYAILPPSLGHWLHSSFWVILCCAVLEARVPWLLIILLVLSSILVGGLAYVLTSPEALPVIGSYAAVSSVLMFALLPAWLLSPIPLSRGEKAAAIVAPIYILLYTGLTPPFLLTSGGLALLFAPVLYVLNRRGR